jgi:hypothetical protein
MPCKALQDVNLLELLTGRDEKCLVKQQKSHSSNLASSSLKLVEFDSFLPESVQLKGNTSFIGSNLPCLLTSKCLDSPNIEFCLLFACFCDSAPANDFQILPLVLNSKNACYFALDFL